MSICNLRFFANARGPSITPIDRMTPLQTTPGLRAVIEAANSRLHFRNLSEWPVTTVRLLPYSWAR